MSARETYRHWKRQTKAVGCVFAQLLAIRPDDFGHRTEVVAARTASGAAARTEKLVGEFIADESVVAAALLFPAITTLPQVVDLALGLSAMPGWTVTRSAVASPDGTDVVAFGITRAIQLDAASSVPSEALVLGDFPDFPNTRRAPVTALEIFLGQPMLTDPKTGAATTRANLAHIPVKGQFQRAFDFMWTQSGVIRRKSLGLAEGQEDRRAKARVSFVIPLELAASLGCAP